MIMKPIGSLLLFFFTVLPGTALVLLLAAHILIESRTEGRLHDSVSTVPETHAALLLGTSRFSVRGGVNSYFLYRIDAAARLYFSGKVQYIIASGDNSRNSYNEPAELKEALIERGIPEDRIVADYAGFRTLDSVVRARKVFGQERFIVVSQAFHNRRAVFIGRSKGFDIWGYNARDIPLHRGFRVMLREQIARVLAVLDVLILKTEPKFLGDPVSVGPMED